MIPVVIRAASQVETWKAPTITRNSPTNPLVPGRPTLAAGTNHTKSASMMPVSSSPISPSRPVSLARRANAIVSGAGLVAPPPLPGRGLPLVPPEPSLDAGETDGSGFGVEVSRGVAVGVGEGIEDLQPFDAHAFARSLVGLEQAS